MKFLTFVSTCVLAVSTLVMQGCTTYPTENANVVDDRPQINFKTTLKDKDLPVFVDGIKVGVMSDFMVNKAALRVLPGTHTVTVQKKDGKKNTQRVFVNDGITKTLIIN